MKDVADLRSDRVHADVEGIELVDHLGIQLLRDGSAGWSAGRKLLASSREVGKLDNNWSSRAQQQPGSRGPGHGNWELSSDRANAARRPWAGGSLRASRPCGLCRHGSARPGRRQGPRTAGVHSCAQPGGSASTADSPTAAGQEIRFRPRSGSMPKKMEPAGPRAHARLSLFPHLEFRPGTGQVSLSASLRQMAHGGTCRARRLPDAGHPSNRSQVTAVMPAPAVGTAWPVPLSPGPATCLHTVLRADGRGAGVSHVCCCRASCSTRRPATVSRRFDRARRGRVPAAVLAESAVPLLLSDGTGTRVDQACRAPGPIVPGAGSADGLDRPARDGRAEGRRVGPASSREPTRRRTRARAGALADRVTFDGTPAMLVGLLDASLRLIPRPRIRRSAGLPSDGREPRAIEARRSSTAMTRSPIGRSVDDPRGRRITELAPAATRPAAGSAADSGDPHVAFAHRDGRDVVLEARVRPRPAGIVARVLALRDSPARPPITRRRPRGEPRAVPRAGRIARRRRRAAGRRSHRSRQQQVRVDARPGR